VIGTNIVLAVIGIFALYIYNGQLKTMRGQLTLMRETFIASSKPSVGVDGIDCAYSGRDKNGNDVPYRFPVKGVTQQINMLVIIKNFGTATASNFTSTWRFYIDGVEQLPHEGHNRSNPPIEMFPGKVVSLIGHVGSDQYQAVMEGKKSVDLEVTVSYDEPGQRYTYCEKDHFEPNTFGFLFKGTCDK